MSKSGESTREDDVLRKMLKTPPKPFTPKKSERESDTQDSRRRSTHQDVKNRGNTKKA